MLRGTVCVNVEIKLKIKINLTAQVKEYIYFLPDFS